MHRNGTQNGTGTVVYDQVTTSAQNNWSLIKHKYRLRKKGKYGIKYSLASASDGPPLMAGGPRWNLGAHAENGVPSPHIFHFNHCTSISDLLRRRRRGDTAAAARARPARTLVGWPPVQSYPATWNPPRSVTTTARYSRLLARGRIAAAP